MTIYWIIYVFFFLFMLSSKWAEKQKKYVFYLFSFLLIFLLYGARNVSVGTDTSAYIKYFNLYQEYSIKELLFGSMWFKRFEPGFIILLKSISSFTNNEHILLLCIGLIYSFLFVTLLARMNKSEKYQYAYLFYSMYLICSGMNVLRQAIAILLLSHAYLFFRQDNKMKTIILCIVATLIHIVSLLIFATMMIYMFIGRNKQKARFIKTFSVLIIILGAFFYKNLFQLAGIDEYITSESADLSIYNLVLIVLIAFYWFFGKTQNKLKVYNFRAAFMETMIIAAFVCCIMGGIAVGFIRITAIFLPMLTFSISDESLLKNSKNMRIIRNIILFFLIIYFEHNLSANISGIVPYKFYTNM